MTGAEKYIEAEYPLWYILGKKRFDIVKNLKSNEEQLIQLAYKNTYKLKTMFHLIGSLSISKIYYSHDKLSKIKENKMNKTKLREMSDTLYTEIQKLDCINDLLMMNKDNEPINLHGLGSLLEGSLGELKNMHDDFGEMLIQ